MALGFLLFVATSWAPEALSAHQGVDSLPAKLGGKPLRQALRSLQQELQRSGRDLVYSNRLVPGDVTLPDTLPEGALEVALRALLSPHDLDLRELDEGTLLVVGAAAAEQPLVVSGRVLSAHSALPIFGARVVLEPVAPEALPPGVDTETVSGPDGTFRFAGLPAGAFLLSASRDDHLGGQRPVVLFEAGPDDRRSEVILELVPRPFLVDEVAVRAATSSLLRDEATAPLARTRSQVEATPRLGSDLLRALAFSAGATTDDISAAPRLRGSRRDEVQITLDGQTLYAPYHLPDYANGLSAVSTTVLDAMDVTTGGFSVSRGERQAGVIDLRTRRPDVGLAGTLGISLVAAEVSLEGAALDGRSSGLIAARVGSVEWVNRIFGQEEPSFWDVLGKGTVRRSDRHELVGRLFLSHNGLSLAEREGDEFKRSSTDYEARQAWISHQSTLGDRLLWSSRVSWFDFDQSRFGLEDEEEQRLELDDQRRTEVFDLRQEMLRQIGPAWALEIGATWRELASDRSYRAQFERELVFFSPRLVTSRPPENANVSTSAAHQSGFAKVVGNLRQWSLESGLRIDDRDGEGARWSPRLSAARRLGEHSLLRAFAGVFRQLPRPDDLALEDGQTRLGHSERSEHLGIGYERRFQTKALRAFRIEAYERRTEDPRLRFFNLYEPFNILSELEPDRVGISADETRARGLELRLDGGSKGGRASWWLDYALARTEERLGPTPHASAKWIAREFDQRHALSVVGQFALPRSWTLSLAWRWHSGWPTTPLAASVPGTSEDEIGENEGDEEDGPLVVELGALQSDRLGTYSRLDLRLSRTWLTLRGNIEFYLDVQNLFDRQNDSGFDTGYDEDEEAIVRTPERWPGIFPSFGVRWRLR